MSSPETIGTVEHNGIVYEIDWLFEDEEEGIRSPMFAVVYFNDVQIADLPSYLGESFTSEEQVMAIAREEIKSGRIA